MTPLQPDEWQRVRECFEDALTVASEQRERYVRDTVADPVLVQQVLSLLAAHAGAELFLDTPAAALFERQIATEDLAGTRLGPYAVQERIGTGGMGDVYRSRDPRLDRVVAIKVLPPNAANDEPSRRRFEREARAVAALNHPHICTLHDIGVAPGAAGDIRYLVMEYLDGETLAERLTRGPLTAATALEYAMQIASALRAAHLAGIVHRDLKPGNIMLTASGAKLLDFGLATFSAMPSSQLTPALSIGRLTSASTLFGTVCYMAPEQLRGEPADARSDIFAFGCVLCEMVTGTRVFDEHRRESVEPPKSPPESPDALENRALTRAGLLHVARVCLEPNPDHRWQTADGLLHQLQQAADTRVRRRRRVLLGAAAVAVTVALAGWAFLPKTSSPAASATTKLAVLPLQAIGDITGDEHLGVAIADAIVTRLAAVRGIQVRPTAAVLNYRNASADIADAATALAVDYVLTGTVQRTPSTYRVTFQLVHGPSGSVEWPRTYEVVRDGLRDLPATVAEQVAGALRLEVASDERDRLRTRYTARTDAYEQYLKGRAALLNYTEAGMKEAIAAFERSLALDSGYALARAGLALASAWWSIRYVNETGEEALRWGGRADREARAALAADPSLAEARLAMAGAAGTLHGGFQWPAVIDDARRALEMDSTLELAHVVLMRAYFHLGLFERMAAEAEAARQLNPLGNVEVARLEVAASLFSGAYVRARDQAVALLARSEAPVIRTYLGLAQFYSGDVETALQTLAAVRRGNVPDVRSQAALASVEAAAGDREAARARALGIEAGPYMDHHVAYSLAGAWAQLGDAAEAVKWLQRAADTGFPCYPSVQRDPLLDGIRQHPRFLAFLDTLRQRHDRDAARYGAAR